jgi:hypothetical protein
MDSAEAAALCAAYHLARARLLVDCLADSQQIAEAKTLEVTLRVIAAEISQAATALGRTSLFSLL